MNFDKVILPEEELDEFDTELPGVLEGGGGGVLDDEVVCCK